MKMLIIFLVIILIGYFAITTLESRKDTQLRKRSSSTLAKSLDSIQRLDSIQQHKKFYPDSALLSQQSIAFGPLKFGMTQKEYDRLPSKQTSYFQKIGDEEYSVIPHFNQSNRLYFVEIKSFSRDAGYIDTYVRNTHNNIKEIIQLKYGQPKFLSDLPTILEYRSGFIRWTNSWEIGKKIIMLGTAEEQSSSEFYSICWIYDQGMKGAYDRYNDAQSKEVKNSDASKF